MRKKKFTGLLMLTAAVALGTVSPAALPNTAVVVKAEVNKIDEDTVFKDAKIEATGMQTVKINKSGIKSSLGNNYKYAFGANSAAALTAALEENAKELRFKDGDEDNAYIDAPVVTNLYLAIVKPSTKTDTNVSGKAITLMAAPSAPNVDSVSDGTQANGANGYEYVEDPDTTVANYDELEWKATDSASNYKIPAEADKVKEGETKKYLVRIKADNYKYASKYTTITITRKKQITFADLKKLSYSITDDNKIRFAGLDKLAELGGEVNYKIVNTADLATEPSTDGTDVANNGMTNAAIEDGKSVVVFVKGDTNKLTNKLAISAEKEKTPVVTQAAVSYQLIASAGSSYAVKGDYNVIKGGTSTKVTSKDGKISVPGDGTYSVVALGDDKTKEIRFEGDNTKAAVKLDSDPQENVVVRKLNNKLDATSFGAITLTTSNAAMKLTIGNIKKSLALEGNDKDKVQYGYEGETPKELDENIDKVDDVPMKEGKFVIEVVGNDSLKKTINFKGVVDKDGKKFMPTYVSSSAVLAAMGTDLAKYQVRPVSAGAMFADATANSFNKEGKYEIKYKNPTSTANIDFKGKNEFEYLLSDVVTIEIKKENKKPSSPSSPVVPSVSGGSGGASYTAPKKDEVKKDEVKKDEAKKDTPKQTDDKKQSDSTSTTETEQSERVSAKNTKNNTVKVSEKKIAEALETGLKVMVKSGKVEFTAKAIEKMIGDSAETVTVTLKTTATKSNAKEVTKNLKGSKLVSKKVFALDIKAGNMAVKESQLKGTKINVTLKVALKSTPKTVWVMDLSTGKRVKAAYKKGKLTFKTSNLGKFVIVNKAE